MEIALHSSLVHTHCINVPVTSDNEQKPKRDIWGSDSAKIESVTSTSHWWFVIFHSLVIRVSNHPEKKYVSGKWIVDDVFFQDESTPVGPAESSGSTPRYAVMMCTMTLGFWSAIVKIFICVLTLPQCCWLPLLLGWRVVTIIVLTQNFTSWLCCHGNFLTNYPPTIPDASHSA